MSFLNNKDLKQDIIENQIIKGGERNIEYPHYIAINVLEISKINLPLKKEVLIFDIDETLYFEPLYLEHLFIETVNVLSEFMKISHEKAHKMYLEIEDGKGMYVRKLMIKHKLSSQFCNDIYLRVIKKGLIKQDKQLEEKLLKLKETKTLICFTNATEVNARYVLDTLGVSNAFNLIIVNDYSRPSIHKPLASAYAAVNSGLGLINDKVEKIVFFDDYPMNCTGAIDAGWQSYQIGPENNIHSYLNQFLKR